MYSRPTYLAVLALVVAAVEFAAAFGTTWQTALAYLLAAALGVVVFYQGERHVTDGPAFVNAGAAILLGTALSLLFSAALVISLLGAPWDLALWQMGLVLWDSWFGTAMVFVSAFFLVGVASSLR